MKISEIINRRRYGRTRINYINELFNDINELLKINGLFPEKENLIEIEYNQAKQIVISLLNYGVAYKEEFMSTQLANEYANFLFEDLDETKYKCFTNGQWNKYYETNGFGFNNLTDATFDGGVLVTTNYCTSASGLKKKTKRLNKEIQKW
jgi:hypothetical protein